MMRNLLYMVCLYLGWSSFLTADITSNLTCYLSLDCALESMNTPFAKEDSLKEPFPSTIPKKGISQNWSGYVSFPTCSPPIRGSISRVSGSWVIPELKTSSHPTYSSIWVGIDGHTNATVEQIGTGHDWQKGMQINYAWFEMYPAFAYQIVGFPLDIGDLIEAEVEYKGHHVFQLSLVNHSKQVYILIPTEYTVSHLAERNSAEWIVEAPSTLKSLLPLANFREVAFTRCIATIHHFEAGIKSHARQAKRLTMATFRGKVKAKPSKLAGDKRSFTVSWYHQ